MPEQRYAWNAADYARNSSAQLGWAEELIQKLGLQGNETVLDVGSGNGRVTAMLASQVPEGSVLGIDSSQDMVDLATRTYPPDDHTNLAFRCIDAREISFQDRFDVVFSNATLHWIRDHTAVLQGIGRSLRSGGKALLQMGGTGNAADILAVIDVLMDSGTWQSYFEGFAFPYGFYGPDDYAAWLPAAGLESLRVELIPKDMAHPGPAGLAGWIRTTWLPYTGKVPSGLRDAFIDEIVDLYLSRFPLDAAGRTHVRMVRLEVEARALPKAE
jgi:trans-aconitate methyltransferase